MYVEWISLVAGGVTVYGFFFLRRNVENYSYIFAIYVTDNLLDINISLEVIYTFLSWTHKVYIDNR